MKLIQSIFAKLGSMQQVHIATTEEEFQALRQMRYEVYTDSKVKDFPGVDHEKRVIFSEEDELPNTTHFYTGTPQELSASMLICHWLPGEIPEYRKKKYSMELFPELESLCVVEVNYLIARKSLRGSMSMVNLAIGAMEHTMKTVSPDLLFGEASAGLLRAYYKLGLRAFGGTPRNTDAGVQIPLVAVLPDIDYLKKVGSPLAPLMAKMKKAGVMRDTPLELLLAPIESGDVLELRAEQIEQEFHRVFDHEKVSFLEKLSPMTQKRLAERGCVLNLAPGVELVKEDALDQEMYIVLSGAVEVVKAGKHLLIRGPGSLLGEVAFFRESGRRSAGLRTLEETKVLVIRRKFIERLKKDNPLEAAELLHQLAVVLTEKLTDTYEP